VDVGQEDDFSKIEERAYKAGAVQHFYIDAKREFAEVYISRAILMNQLPLRSSRETWRTMANKSGRAR